MDELFFQLETRIRSLIEKFDQQKESNIKLQQNHKTAISQIENLITRLKSIENPS